MSGRRLRRRVRRWLGLPNPIRYRVVEVGDPYPGWDRVHKARPGREAQP